MSKVDILIVEDNDLIARELKIVLIEKGYNPIKVVNNGPSAIQVVKENTPDLIIMDVHINGPMDGIETAGKIAEVYPTPIIYLTSYNDKATYNRAKKTYPEAFLSKPFNDNDLSHAIDLAMQNFSLRKKADEGEDLHEEFGNYLMNDSVYVRSDNRYEKVKISELQYVAAEGSYCLIKTPEKELLLSLNLSTFCQKFHHPCLMRVHRSFVINIDLVDSFELGKVFIGKHEIPVSRRYRDEFVGRMRHL